MSVTRLLFVAEYRIPSACVSLQFDQFLIGIDKTVIVTPCDVLKLDKIFKNHNIDTADFDYLSDEEFVPKYPGIQKWIIPGDYRGNWLRQQAIKLACLDYLDYPVMMIQDPDTFAIADYQCWDGTTLNFMILPNTTHARGYYEVLANALGIARQTPHCFVTEFGPCLKKDIVELKQHIEKQNNQNWLTALIDHVPYESTFNPNKPDELVKWFSEYELLGNWTMSRRPVKLTDQKRFEYKTLDQLHKLNGEYRVAADAMPMEQSFCLDPTTGLVENYQHWVNVVNSRIQ